MNRAKYTKKSLPNSLLCVPDAVDCNDDYVVCLGRKEKLLVGWYVNEL